MAIFCEFTDDVSLGSRDWALKECIAVLVNNANQT